MTKKIEEMLKAAFAKEYHTNEEVFAIIRDAYVLGLEAGFNGASKAANEGIKAVFDKIDEKKETA